MSAASSTHPPLSVSGPPLAPLVHSGSERAKRAQELAAAMKDGRVPENFTCINSSDMFNDDTPLAMLDKFDLKCSNGMPPCQCSERGLVTCDDDCVNYVMSMDCDSTVCSTWDAQRGGCWNTHLSSVIGSVTGCIDDSCSIRDAGRKGLGLFATQPIKSGTIVGVYLGELITEQQLRFRTQMAARHSSNLNPFGMRYFAKLAKDAIIDAKFCGNLTRFANNGGKKESNCKMVKWVRKDHVRGKGRYLQYLCLQAICDIDIDEEITFDYGSAFFA